MQEKDAISIEYFEDKKRIADLLNGYIFEGEQIVRPEHVGELNRSMARITKKTGKLQAQVLIHDLVRKLHISCKVVLIALESQSEIHYAMPVRVMNTDAAGYDAQLRKKKKKHRQRKDLEGAEFLSGFAREDKLLPIISIVLYFGKKEWDGAKNLKGLLDLTEIPEPLQQFVPDYSMNLLEVRKYTHLEYFQSDLQYVFGFLQNAEESDELEQYVEENQEEFLNLEEDAYDLISVMSNSKELQRVKSNYQEEKGGTVDMCQAIKDLIQAGEERGKAIGFAEGEKRGEQRGEEHGEKRGEKRGIQLARSVFHFNSMNLSPEEIAENCGITVEKVQFILGVDEKQQS